MPWHIKKRGMNGHNLTKGVLGMGTTRIRGVLGTGAIRKGGGGVLRTAFVKRSGSWQLLVLHKRGLLGPYLLITFTLSYQHDQPVWVCSSTLTERALRIGHNRENGGGVLGTGTT